MPTSVKPPVPEPAATAPAATPAPARSLSKAAQKRIAIGAGLAAVALGAGFVLVSGSNRKEDFAQRQLNQARATAESGDLAGAAGQFQSLATTYGGTDAAAEAIIGLNQVRLINGQNELAVTGIREFIASKPDREFLPPAYGLLGSALENAAKPAEAAEAYRNAAGAADVDYLRASYLVESGRALTTANQRDAAAQVYRDVISRYPDTPMMTEAKVRLAELTAGKM